MLTARGKRQPSPALASSSEPQGHVQQAMAALAWVPGQQGWAVGGCCGEDGAGQVNMEWVAEAWSTNPALSVSPWNWKCY